MTCDDAGTLIDAFAEDALDEPQRVAVAEHVAGCARCRRAVEASRRLTLSLAALPAARTPATTDARVLAAVEEDRRYAASLGRTRRLLGAAAAFAAVAVAGLAVAAASPVPAIVVGRGESLVREAALWLRWNAVPAVDAATGPAIAVAALVLLVAATERLTLRVRTSPRVAR